jgi:hypothetical protein
MIQGEGQKSQIQLAGNTGCTDLEKLNLYKQKIWPGKSVKLGGRRQVGRMKSIVFPCQPAPPCFPAADSPPAPPKSFRATGKAVPERSIPGPLQRCPDRVIRLERATGVSGILVERGVVWVTETPAAGGIPLCQGGYLPFRGDWPVNLQAMTEGSIILR